MSMQRRPLGRGRTLATVAGLAHRRRLHPPVVDRRGDDSGIPAVSGNGLDTSGSSSSCVGIVSLALVALPYAAGDRPLGLDRWLSFAMLAVVGWLAFAIRIVVLVGNGAFQFSEPAQVFTDRAGPVGHGAGLVMLARVRVHDVARIRLPVTAGGLDRLEGVWTIVPTPFTRRRRAGYGQPAGADPLHRGPGRRRHDDPGCPRRGGSARRRRARDGHRAGSWRLPGICPCVSE